MKKVLIVFSLLFVTNVSTSFAQETEIQKDIKELLVLTGSGKLGIQVASQMIASFKQSVPNVSAQFWDDFAKEINADELIELIIPIYEKHYTHNEIKEMIAFYNTPLGKKITAVLPQLTQDSMLAGQEWGKKIAEKALEKLKESGY